MPDESFIRIQRAELAFPASHVARQLIGCFLLSRVDGVLAGGMIVETEAYVGPEDRASHAYQGRRTPRVESMYAQPGTAYVYFTYGVHFCLNVACLRQGHPAAVLVRAIAPAHGLKIMAVRRGAHPIEKLCRGPGNLCKALGVGSIHDSVDLCSSDVLFLARPGTPSPLCSPAKVVTSPRIGIGERGIWTRRLLRYSLKSSLFVSRSSPLSPQKPVVEVATVSPTKQAPRTTLITPVTPVTPTKAPMPRPRPTLSAPTNAPSTRRSRPS